MSAAVEAKQSELHQLETLRFVTGAFFELSAEKIGRLRIAFEKNQRFFTEVAELYEAVKQAAAPSTAAAQASAKTSRDIFVAFTSNAHFYGSVNADVIRVFVDRAMRSPGDLLVIGETGKSFVEEYPLLKSRLTYVSFQGDDPSKVESEQFLRRVAAYDHVYLFHPAFLNIFTQVASELDITHAPASASEGRAAPAEKRFEYLFEPELSKILKFFETRVRYLLFQRVMLEAELARTAARLLAMDNAESKANTALATLQRTIRREVETFNDSRLLEAFSAIAKWRT